MLPSRSFVSSLVLVALTACADKQPKPVMVSAAGLPSYAVRYAERLSAETAQLVADKQHASEQSQQLSARTAELKSDADPATLLVVVRQADLAGRTEAYARANVEARTLRAFWEEERSPIASRANAAAQKQMGERGCGACAELDLGGTLGYALSAGIDKQLEKRLREANEAQRTIEANRVQLGTANVATVQKLADDIALTSFEVNVVLPQARDRVAAMLAEQGDVDETLARAIEWEQRYQASNRSAAEKKQSQARLATLGESRAAIPSAVAAAEAARKDLDPHIEALRERYSQTLGALERELEAKQASGKK